MGEQIFRVLGPIVYLALGFLLGYAYRKPQKRTRRKKPFTPGLADEVGPGIFTVSHRRSPKVITDSDIWQREQARKREKPVVD